VRITSIKTNVHVATGAGATNNKVTDEEVIDIVINYPLQTELIHRAEKEGGFTVRDFAESLLDGYKLIYRDPKRFGVWGHGLGDLFLESIEEIEPGKFKAVMGS
jgi:hypothetical protein